MGARNYFEKLYISVLNVMQINGFNEFNNSFIES